VIDGRRSVVAWWPPTAVCEKCGAAATSSGGYVGPVVGDVVRYPAPETRFVCVPCARAHVGLGEHELTGHTCGSCPSDELHVDPGYHGRGELEDMSDAERIAHVSAKDDYPARGWKVVAVQPAPHRLKTTGTPWDTYITPARRLW
jgi:hypothetical protein